MPKPILPALMGATLLTACGFIDFDTAEQFSNMSPLTADPGAVTVFLDLPNGLGILPGSGSVTFGANRTDTGESDFEMYTLQTIEADGMIGFRLDPADWPRFRGQQLRLQAWENTAPRATEGTFAVGGEPCGIGPGPLPDATASVLVQFASETTRRPLINDAPIAEVFDQLDLDVMPPCNG